MGGRMSSLGGIRVAAVAAALIGTFSQGVAEEAPHPWRSPTSTSSPCLRRACSQIRSWWSAATPSPPSDPNCRQRPRSSMAKASSSSPASPKCSPTCRMTPTTAMMCCSFGSRTASRSCAACWGIKAICNCASNSSAEKCWAPSAHGRPSLQRPHHLRTFFLGLDGAPAEEGRL